MLTKEQLGDRRMISTTTQLGNTMWMSDLVFIRNVEEEDTVHIVFKVEDPDLCSISFAYLGVIKGDVMYPYSVDDSTFSDAYKMVHYAMITGREMIGYFDDKIKQAVTYVQGVYNDTPNLFREFLVEAINSDNPYISRDASYVIKRTIKEL